MHSHACAFLQMQIAWTRLGSQTKFCPPALVVFIFTSFIERELQWGRQAGQAGEGKIKVPYGSGWKTDGGSLKKANLLSSGILRNVLLLGH